jgi:hypothetical protein
MSSQAIWSGPPAQAQTGSPQLCVAFLGPPSWLDGCAPTSGADTALAEVEIAPAGTGLAPAEVELATAPIALSPAPIELAPAWIELGPGADAEHVLARARAIDAEVTVVFDPASAPAALLRELPGVTLGLHPRDSVDAELQAVAGALDRVASFFPALTGEQAGPSQRLWRAIPPPVSDAVYADVRRPQTAMQAMTVGRSTDHRERMLLEAKHHHDLLQVVHGVSGEPLIELLREYDVGVYVSPRPGGAYGAQIGMHLAAGQLLLTEAPTPAHGLERNIDYLYFDSPVGLVWTLDRLQRFPEMYHRIRVRGRLKAEQYRASRVFARIAHDLLADVRAFGSPRS